MSVDLLYPDNKPRGERVSQLISQIASLKTMAKVNNTTVTDQLKVIDGKVPDVLQKHGLESVDDLRKQLMNTMPDDVRKKYKDLLDKYGDKDSLEGKIIDITGLITFGAGLTGTAAKIAELMSTGEIAISISYILSALATAGKDASEAVRLLKAAALIMKSASTTWKLSEGTLKIIKYVKIFGEVVAAVGLLIDGIILIIAAIEGAKQRTHLEDAIHDLAYSRITAQTLSCFGDIYSQYISSMYAIIASMTIKPSDSIDKIIDTLINTTCDDMKTGLEHLTFDTVYGYLKSLDEDQPPAYKGDNAEPDEATLKTWWDSGEAPNFRYKGDVPKQG